MFCALGLVYGGSEGLVSRFHVLCFRTRFRWYRGRRVPFSCFVLSDSFTAVLMASGPDFMFLRPVLVFGGTGGVGSCFLVLHARTRFRRFRGRRVPFSSSARPDSFSAVSRASCPVFLFCAPELVFGGTKGVGSSFHVLRSRTHFRWYRRRRVLFSCFARPDSFWAVLRASGPVFMFCAPERILDGTEGVRSRFHVLRAHTLIPRY
jgi:hypothetical protein